MEPIENDQARRRKWQDIGTGMVIVLSMFLLADGIGKIVHHNDFGWFLAPAWTFVLVLNVFRALKH